MSYAIELNAIHNACNRCDDLYSLAILFVDELLAHINKRPDTGITATRIDPITLNIEFCGIVSIATAEIRLSTELKSGSFVTYLLSESDGKQVREELFPPHIFDTNGNIAETCIIGNYAQKYLAEFMIALFGKSPIIKKSPRKDS